MRNGRTGQYELSQSQMDTVIDKYRLHLPTKKNCSGSKTTMHPKHRTLFWCGALRSPFRNGDA